MRAGGSSSTTAKWLDRSPVAESFRDLSLGRQIVRSVKLLPGRCITERAFLALPVPVEERFIVIWPRLVSLGLPVAAYGAVAFGLARSARVLVGYELDRLAISCRVYFEYFAPKRTGTQAESLTAVRWLCSSDRSWSTVSYRRPSDAVDVDLLLDRVVGRGQWNAAQRPLQSIIRRTCGADRLADVLEVRDHRSQRRSIDASSAGSTVTLGDLFVDLDESAQAFGVAERPSTRMAGSREHVVGRIAVGVGAQGDPFLTLYHQMPVSRPFRAYQAHDEK